MSLNTITWKTKVKYIVFSIYGKDDYNDSVKQSV